VSLNGLTDVVALTSDEFFRTRDVAATLGGPVDLAFIDGMHLAEFALRDFMNIEAVATRSSVVLVDDVLPADMVIASRAKREGAWTGDVYRMIFSLRRHRPDLRIRIYDAPIKGLAVITELNPASRILRDSIAALEMELAGGAYTVADAAALRRAFQPRSTHKLRNDLLAIAKGRNAH
jgi:hypothetical protein